jgi:hypothetical protein
VVLLNDDHELMGSAAGARTTFFAFVSSGIRCSCALFLHEAVNTNAESGTADPSIRGALITYSVKSRAESLGRTSEKITAIQPETLHGVFEHWTARLEWVSQKGGDCDP